MSYFVVESFGHGLDARRHILNLPPGALYRAKNVNLNRGGEPEACKAFVAKGTLPPGQTFGLLAAGGKLFTFGSVADPGLPAGLTYQRLIHPTGGAMTAMVHGTVVKGKPFVIASFVSGYGVFFNGLFITDWLPPAGALAMRRSDGTVAPYTTLADIANNLAGQIQASAIYTATAAGNILTITGRPGVPFTLTTSAVNGGGVDDQLAVPALIQAADPGVAEARSKGTITFSGVLPEWDPPTEQYFPVAVCTSIKVNGVEVCDAFVMASDSGEAASAVVNMMAIYHSAVEYQAVASGNTVTLTALPGTGAGPNGYNIVVTGGQAPGGGARNYATVTPFAGGGGTVPTKSQISTVAFAGTFEAGDHWTVTLDGVPYTPAAFVPPTGGDTGDGGGGTGGDSAPGSASGQRPVMALTKNSKTYAIAGPNLFGSMIGDCTKWNSGTGVFITDMSSELAGAEILTALALYQGNLAVFSRTTIQVYFVDPDPANNEQLQALQNIGTMAGRTVTSFGDTDVFFLSDTGLRSLKTRTGTNSATLSDIGSPVDPLVTAAILAAGANIKLAVATMEPVDGRFLLQIGTTTFVFNYFPDAKVGGWTTWESGLAISDFAILEQKLFARAGDTVYLLGGDNNDQYSPQAVDIQLPFLSARQIATLKHFTALDVACDGTFDIYIATDPTRPDEQEVIATTAGSTYSLGIDPLQAEDVTAIALRFVGRPGKYNRLSSIAIHHEVLKENA